jgi:hypothetical protein
MNSQFTYSTRTGNKVRSYVKVAFVIFVVIAALALVAGVNRNQLVSEVMATPRPLDANLIASETAVVAAPAVPVEGCPSDPASWTLADNPATLGSNLQLLTPQCVYDNLEKTAAWVYAATALGYTRADAAAKLGLSLDGLIAYPTNSQITVLTDFVDQPQTIDVVIAADNAQFAEWSVNANGGIGLELTFSGCFSTATLSGGEIQTWGSHPVICQYFADYRTQYNVSSINGHLYTGESVKNVRRPMWFGYIGNGNWAWLGSGKVWDADLSQLPAQNPTLTTTVMAEKYGMPVTPLPLNWQSAVGQEFVDALLAELNKDQ